MKKGRRDFLKIAGISGISLASTKIIPHHTIGKNYLDNTGNSSDWSENIQTILDNTKPLKYPRGKRLPLYLWPAIDPGKFDEKTTSHLLKELDDRGIGVICSWNMANIKESLSSGINIAHTQKKLGQPVNINATSLLYSFFNGDERTAHIDNDGHPFFDDSFGKSYKMGCPFTLDSRKEEIRKRVALFAKAYKDAGLSIDFIFTDWEIDGPSPGNGAYAASHKCKRCRTYLGEEFTFTKFQKTMREMRAYLQHYSFSNPILFYFPNALVGNYGDYPNDGYRYWYDYYEYLADWQPYKTDQHAKYRTWYDNFPATGFTFAMPVVYTWSDIYHWYDFENTDYRWFYNMLLVASNAGKKTPQCIPVISFVHWNTIFIGNDALNSGVKQMSTVAYKELLWHMLLRGTDTFFMWSEKKDFPEEVKLVHEVYSSAQQYADFLAYGSPITYEVPNNPGIVISGLTFGNKALVRRTDFGGNHTSVGIFAGTKQVQVNYVPEECQIIHI